jgi:hypothetical protein
MLAWIKDRLGEKSTLVGIAGVVVTALGIFGVIVSPELKEAITAGVLALSSIVLVVVKAQK